MCGLPYGWGGGGYEGKKKFVYLKWASHFWLSIQKFHFSPKEIIFGCVWVGGRVVWPGRVGLPDHPPPLPCVVKQNPASCTVPVLPASLAVRMRPCTLLSFS